MVVKTLELTDDEITILKESLERTQEITVSRVEELTIDGLLEKLDM